MTHRRFITVVLLAATALTTHVAVTDAGPRHGQIDFPSLDADGDGQITKEEMQDHAADRFQRSDVDENGKLDRAELEAAAQVRSTKRVARMLNRLDADEDGALSLDEMPARRGSERFFDRADADDSGTISQEEFADMQAHMAQRRHKGSKKN